LDTSFDTFLDKISIPPGGSTLWAEIDRRYPVTPWGRHGAMGAPGGPRAWGLGHGEPWRSHRKSMVLYGLETMVIYHDINPWFYIHGFIWFV